MPCAISTNWSINIRGVTATSLKWPQILSNAFGSTWTEYVRSPLSLSRFFIRSSSRSSDSLKISLPSSTRRNALTWLERNSRESFGAMISSRPSLSHATLPVRHVIPLFIVVIDKRSPQSLSGARVLHLKSEFSFHSIYKRCASNRNEIDQKAPLMMQHIIDRICLVPRL